MPANQNPIYTLTPRIESTGNALTSAAADYRGLNLNNFCVFQAGANGSYIQKIRFKAVGTTSAAVARIYLNNGLSPRANVCGNVGGLTGTPQTSGGVLQTGTFVGKVYTVDPWGAVSSNSAEVTVNTTGPTARIDWFWTANTGANSYVIVVGARTSEPLATFSNANASFQQTVYKGTDGFLNTLPFGQFNSPGGFTSVLNSSVYGEVSLPAVTAVTAASTVDVDYPMNLALPAGYKILIGLGAVTTAGWDITVVGGDY